MNGRSASPSRMQMPGQSIFAPKQFVQRFKWAGAVTRSGEGGRRGATMRRCVAVDCHHSLVDASCDMTIRSEWVTQALGAGTGAVAVDVYEDELTLSFAPATQCAAQGAAAGAAEKGKGRLQVAGHCALGLAGASTADPAAAGLGECGLAPGWVVCAPQIPGPESEGVHTQAQRGLAIRTGGKAGGKEEEGATMGRMRAFVGVRVGREELEMVEVEHEVELFETRLVRTPAPRPPFSLPARRLPTALLIAALLRRSAATPSRQASVRWPEPSLP